MLQQAYLSFWSSARQWTYLAEILFSPGGAKLGSCICTIAKLDFMYCRPVMSFVMSFTRISRVTQIVGARGFIKGACEVSQGCFTKHQHLPLIEYL